VACPKTKLVNMDERKSSQNGALPSSDKSLKQKMVYKPRDLTVEQQQWNKDFNQDQTITAGVEDQVHEVLHTILDQFEDTEGPRMTTFQKVWKQTSFGLIFHGRESFRELYEFTEDMFDIVKQYALKARKKVDNPEGIRFAALYLLYALYFKQPCRPKVKIRLTLEEFDEMVEFMEETKDCYHYDVVYAWAKLFSEAAFHYVAAPGQLGLELAYQLEQKEIKSKEEKKRGKTDFLSTVQFQKLMQNVSKSHEKYQNWKKDLVEANPDHNNVLSGTITDNDLPATLLNIVESSTEKKNQQKKDDIGGKRSELKHKYWSSIDVQSNRDRLFTEWHRKENSQLEDGTGIQNKEEEIQDELENMQLKEGAGDYVPFEGEPTSELRGGNNQRGMIRKRGRPKGSGAVFIREDELEIDNEEVGGNRQERQPKPSRGKRERGKHGRKGQIRPDGWVDGRLGRGKRGRGTRGRGVRGRARGRGMTYEVGEGDNNQNCNREDMEDFENYDMMEGSSSGAGSSGLRSRGTGRGRGGKNRRGARFTDDSGVMADTFDDVEEQGDASGQVGEKMEKAMAMVKRKNMKGMWGNAASRNLHQEEQVEHEIVFRFNNNNTQ